MTEETPLNAKPIMDGPEFDRDGYPTEETLSKIELWPLGLASGSAKDWLAYCRSAWAYPTYWSQFTDDKGNLHVDISTGGWSGNEDIVDAMESNIMWSLSWQMSRRGGHYTLMFRPEMLGEKDDA